MAEDFTKQVNKFDGTNFQTWKFQVRAILVAYKIHDVVTGSRTVPEDLTGNDGIKWITDNARAMVVLSQTMTSSQLDNLITCETALDMWNKLVLIHEQKSESNKLTLMQKFHEYRMDSCDSVIQHITKVQNMARHLKDVGESISDVAIMAKILGSLPQKYGALVTAWDSVDPGKQTISNLQERLLKEERRLQASDEENNALIVAAVSSHKKSGFEQRNKSQGQNTSNGYQGEAVTCYYCKRPGHIARRCRKKKYDQRQRKQGGQRNEDNRVSAFVVTSRDNRDSMCRDSNTSGHVEQIEQFMCENVKDVWITDSGASKHITFRRDWFAELRPSHGEKIALGDDGLCEVKGVGTIMIKKFLNGSWIDGRIENVLYVPNIKKNLFSVGVCTSKNYSVVFSGQSVELFRGQELMAQGAKQTNDIYRMFFKVVPVLEANVCTTDLRMLHERMAHINIKTLQDMAKRGLLPEIKTSEVNSFFCEACMHGKLHRLPFRKNDCEKRFLQPGEMFHSDVSPIPVASVGGARYFLLFKDDTTSYRYVYFMKHKSDVFERFKEFERAIANKFERTMKVLRIDNGTEYCNSAMKEYLISKGIKLETTAPYTPEQNGRSERENRTIMESVRAMLHAKNLPYNLWAEAVSTAVYVLNRSLSSRNPETTPYEEWTGKKPSLKHLKVFGAEAFKHIPKKFRKKLDSKAKKLIFVGYQADSKNYRLYDPDSRKISVSRDVLFHEEVQGDRTTIPAETFSFSLDWDTGADRIQQQEDQVPGQVLEDDVVEVQLQQQGQPVNENLVPERQQAEERLASRVEPHNLRDRQLLQRPARFAEANYVEWQEPETFQDAVCGSDAENWLAAINDELEAHRKNGTWSIVPKPEDRNCLDSKWVFKLQRKESGEVKRFEARLCARGFRQQPGLDYTETFSPVVRYDSLRVVLAIATHQDLEMVQFDVRTAFLHGILEEEIYMKIPEGLQVSGDENRLVCKLNKALYGLKQASRCWNQTFSMFLERFGFEKCNAENSLYYSNFNEENVFLALFVDDGLIMAKTKQTLEKIILALQSGFDITFGDPSMFVGVQIERNRDGKEMFIHQSAYTQRILSKFNMQDAHPVSTPAEPGTVLRSPGPDDDVNLASIPFREAVGSLMFLSIVSRPDISFAVNLVSRFLSNYDHTHWQAVKRIFKYLRGTVDLGIMYKSSGIELELIGYTDSDFAGDIDTRRSTSGFIFELADGPVTWSSQRQRMVTLSTTEAEYVAASLATREALWLRQLLNDVGLTCKGPTTLKVDNQSAIRLVKNSEYHKRTKHIDIQYHFIREKYVSSEIQVINVPSEYEYADILTKALPKERFRFLRDSLGMMCESDVKY